MESGLENFLKLWNWIHQTVELDSPNCGIGIDNFSKLWNSIHKTVEFDLRNCGIGNCGIGNCGIGNCGIESEVINHIKTYLVLIDLRVENK